MFQFTHPCGCDNQFRSKIGVMFGFQFTHPCGCDNTPIGDNKKIIVSIHAPVWVRQVGTKTANAITLFQFTHPCGCDNITEESAMLLHGFNSRTRVGATTVVRTASGEEKVSIHAPVWVRQEEAAPASEKIWFQFTHPCGCDKKTRRTMAQDGVFQFTHPCGCDPGAVSCGFRLPGFNSRTRVGATVQRAAQAQKKKVSIHAPVWVRLDFPGFHAHDIVVSIHAPVWVRHPSGAGTKRGKRFQFTHPCGCDFIKGRETSQE